MRIYIILCSRKEAMKQQISNLTYFKKNIFLLLLALCFSFHISFWSHSLFRLLLEFSFWKPNRAGHPPPPKPPTLLRDARKKFQSTLVSSVSYSAHAHYPLLAIVTLMHWLGNICGMLIPPQFQWRCGIPTYCLSSTVSQPVCQFRWWVLIIPHRQTRESGWISISKR